MKSIAFLDANVLYPATTRSVLLFLAGAGLFVPLWSDKVHEEWTRNLLQQNPQLDAGRIARTRALMEASAEGANVTGYEPLIDSLTLPDAKDRHVLAAAIHGGADIIVTKNLKDFPPDTLSPHSIVPQHPDAFVLSLIKTDEASSLAALAADRANLRHPAMTDLEYIAALEHNDLKATAAALRPMADKL